MLSKDIVKKIKHIELYTRRLLRGTQFGDSRSAQKGTGLEFDQIREYQQGDDVRFIDWCASARMDKLLVKQYFEERNRTIVLIVDVSASTSFSSSLSKKQDIIAQIASVLALVADFGKDKVSLVLCTDEVELFIPPQKGRNHSYRIMEKLFSFKPKSKKTNLKAAFDHLGALRAKDAMVFVISDFIDQNFESSLRVAAKIYDVAAIRCLDKNEHALPRVGFIAVQDSETGEHAVFDTRKKLVNRINVFLQKRLDDQHALFKKSGVDCIDVATDRPFMGNLIRFFRKRMSY